MTSKNIMSFSIFVFLFLVSVSGHGLRDENYDISFDSILRTADEKSSDPSTFYQTPPIQVQMVKKSVDPNPPNDETQELDQDPCPSRRQYDYNIYDERAYPVTKATAGPLIWRPVLPIKNKPKTSKPTYQSYTVVTLPKNDLQQDFPNEEQQHKSKRGKWERENIKSEPEPEYKKGEYQPEYNKYESPREKQTKEYQPDYKNYELPQETQKEDSSKISDIFQGTDLRDPKLDLLSSLLLNAKNQPTPSANPYSFPVSFPAQFAAPYTTPYSPPFPTTNPTSYPGAYPAAYPYPSANPGSYPPYPPPFSASYPDSYPVSYRADETPSSPIAISSIPSSTSSINPTTESTVQTELSVAPEISPYQSILSNNKKPVLTMAPSIKLPGDDDDIGGNAKDLINFLRNNKQTPDSDSTIQQINEYSSDIPTDLLGFLGEYNNKFTSPKYLLPENIPEEPTPTLAKAVVPKRVNQPRKKCVVNNTQNEYAEVIDSRRSSNDINVIYSKVDLKENENNNPELRVDSNNNGKVNASVDLEYNKDESEGNTDDFSQFGRLSRSRGFLNSARVCFACSSLSDPTCWSPSRTTTVKYCRIGSYCVTRKYSAEGEGSEEEPIVIRDCSKSCEVTLANKILENRYEACSICGEDLCNNSTMNNSSSAHFNQLNVLPILLITGLLKLIKL